jgi:hypothetical protein
MTTLGREQGNGGKDYPVTHKLIRDAAADMVGSGVMEEIGITQSGGDITVPAFRARTQAYTANKGGLPNIWEHPGGVITSGFIPDDSTNLLYARNNGTFIFYNEYDPWVVDRLPIATVVKEGGVITALSEIGLSGVNLSDKVHCMLHMLKGIKEPSSISTSGTLGINIDNRQGVSVLSSFAYNGQLMDGLGVFSASTNFAYCNGTSLIGAVGSQINPNIWQGGAVGNNKFTIQRLYAIPYKFSALMRMQVGSVEYNTLDEACAAINTESFSAYPPVQKYGVLYGYVVIQEGTANWTDDSRFCLFGTDQLGNPILPSTAGGGTDLDFIDVATGLPPVDNTSAIYRIGDTLIGSSNRVKVAKLEVNGHINGVSYNHKDITRFTGSNITLDDNSNVVLYYNALTVGSNAILTDPTTWTNRDTTDAYFWIYNTSLNSIDVRYGGVPIIILEADQATIVRWDNVEWRAWGASDSDFIDEATSSKPTDVNRITRTGEASGARFIGKYVNEETIISSPQVLGSVFSTIDPRSFPYQHLTVSSKLFLGLRGTGIGCYYWIKNNEASTNEIEVQNEGGAPRIILQPGDSAKLVKVTAVDWIAYSGQSGGSGGSDADWFTVGTADAPTSIADTIYHTGDAHIGTSSVTPTSVNSALSVYDKGIAGLNFRHLPDSINFNAGTFQNSIPSSASIVYCDAQSNNFLLVLPNPVLTPGEEIDTYVWVKNTNLLNSISLHHHDTITGELHNIAADGFVIARWDGANWNMFGSSGGGAGLTSLTEDNVWVGDNTNTPIETPIKAMVSGTLTLGVGGVSTINNTNITVSSKAVATPVIGANLLGGSYTFDAPTAGSIVFRASNSGATGSFNYIIV